MRSTRESTRENSRESNNGRTQRNDEKFKGKVREKESKSNKGGRSIKKFNIFVNACIKIS